MVQGQHPEEESLAETEEERQVPGGLHDVHALRRHLGLWSHPGRGAGLAGE